MTSSNLEYTNEFMCLLDCPQTHGISHMTVKNWGATGEGSSCPQAIENFISLPDIENAIF